jgi:hypothetical protein
MSLPRKVFITSYLPTALRFALGSWVLSGTVSAAVTLDPAFWDDYRPYQQYSPETIRDLIALSEGDLLETAREIDGLELRVVGRTSPISRLISARVVIDSVARQRLQVKVIPFDPSPNGRQRPALTRRLLSDEEAQELTALLIELKFWNAPYRLDGRDEIDRAAADCNEANGWIVEAVRPGAYQLISRTNCDSPDSAASRIRDYLLGLAGVSVADSE